MENFALQQEISLLRQKLEVLTAEVYKNNFSASQDNNKYVRFNSRLKVPHVTALPSTGEVGEILEFSGKLYICSATNTFSLVGTQT